MKITLGCDPEAFLVDMQGQLHSSIGKIGGSKEAPMELVELGKGYAVQEDNVALEFNIPPAEGLSEFVESINKTLKYLTAGVNSMYGYELSRLSAASFPEEELQDAAAKVFGCDPDFNAWTKDKNPRPKANDPRLRSCGGHVHIGYNKGLIEPTEIIKNCDKFLGVPSILMDMGEVRKELYGGPGAYREKPYGVEYRTLSNFWIFNDRLIQWVWENTSKAAAAAESRLAISEQDSTDIVNCIQYNDKQLAEKLVKKFNLEVVYV